MMAKKVQSVEPQVAHNTDFVLKQFNRDVKLEQDRLNDEIESALDEYVSKSGGRGGNRPDAKMLLKDSRLNEYPVLIECKGYKDKLVKLDSNGQVENRNAKGENIYKNINSYAVNGAVHYANALLHYTHYTEIIAIGTTGFVDSNGQIQQLYGVYLVSAQNMGAGQKIGDYEDLSFLAPQHFDEFTQKLRDLNLTDADRERIKQARELEIDVKLRLLNKDIYQNEKGLSESDRIYLVAAAIIANLGIKGKVAPLEKKDLLSSDEVGNTDGDIMLRKITAYFNARRLPKQKSAAILRTLQNTITSQNIVKPINGESQLKRIFTKIVDDLGLYYKIGLTTDFTGKLFNEMYSWLGFTQDKLNDVVLTPQYVALLLARLARIDRNSYVWDFATGSAGLLVAAMNEMLADARAKINSPEELAKKESHIKGRQLLGIELLPNIYMLSVLNMILMGDGSSNLLNEDSLLTFDGKYGYGGEGQFPATAFILNPPYSAPGNGMVFVEKALSMMHTGYAAIIIQNSAGTGKAKDFNKSILKHSTLLASIKMPLDLFIGKSSVQTYIYVFRVGETHQKDDVVRFIDFTKDGYTRANRKKAASSVNLRDTDHARERYQEVADLVRYGGGKLHYLADKEFFEGHIDPTRGDDWNQTAPIDTRPTLSDFKRTVADYLAFEVRNLLTSRCLTPEEEERLGK